MDENVLAAKERIVDKFAIVVVVLARHHFFVCSYTNQNQNKQPVNAVKIETPNTERRPNLKFCCHVGISAYRICDCLTV